MNIAGELGVVYGLLGAAIACGRSESKTKQYRIGTA